METIYDRYFREFYCKLTDSFPEEDIESLHKDLSSLGKQGWKDWLLLHHDEILKFLDEMPSNLEGGLDYQKNGRLYLAAEYHIRRAVIVLQVVDAVVPSVSKQPQGKSLSVAANCCDALVSMDQQPLWGLDDNSPFDEP